VQESIIADFQRKELIIASVSEPDLCSADPSSILMRQLLEEFIRWNGPMRLACDVCWFLLKTPLT
jgi:hypothetical protein